jgi:hypothetical protein
MMGGHSRLIDIVAPLPFPPYSWPHTSWSERLQHMAGIDTSSRDSWTRVNTALTMWSALTLVGAIEVFLFGVLWTHGVYGSRMAWLVGVVLPLLAITAGLGWAGARHGVNPGPSSAEGVHQGTDPGSHRGRRDRRSAPKAVGIVSLVLIGIPLALVGLLLMTYGLIFISHWFR